MHKALLKLLADGEFHSGESLGKHLGMSRAAVWKHIQHLQEKGLALESVKGKGYIVAGGLDLLDANTIAEEYKKSVGQGLQHLQVETEMDSTSQQLLRRSAANEDIHGAACFAELQTAGRGRRGRSWQSPFASNLYFSLGWRIQSGVAAVEGLSLAVGVALCEALETFGFCDVQLKWPNDLLYKGKKLGGILLEISGDAAGECDLIIGVGLNVAMPESASQNIDQPWVDVKALAREQKINLPSRNLLAARCLQSLFAMLAKFESLGFAAWQAAWQKRNAHQNTEVQLLMGKQQVNGRVLGVDTSGALLLKTSQGEQSFIGGEISLRAVVSDKKSER